MRALLIIRPHRGSCNFSEHVARGLVCGLELKSLQSSPGRVHCSSRSSLALICLSPHICCLGHKNRTLDTTASLYCTSPEAEDLHPPQAGSALLAAKRLAADWAQTGLYEFSMCKACCFPIVGGQALLDENTR